MDLELKYRALLDKCSENRDTAKVYYEKKIKALQDRLIEIRKVSEVCIKDICNTLKADARQKDDLLYGFLDKVFLED